MSAARLAEIAGAANVTEDRALLAGYAAGGAMPQAVVRPASSEEVAEIVKLAAAERLAIVACGARTKLGMGLPPRRYDIALDMTRMDRVIAYDPGDLTLSVEAGIPFCQVQTRLAGHGQFLPLAPPWMRRATAGGTIAAGVDGPLRQLYGTARDFVLGMEFVTGEGVVAKSGGRVVKNVTGYDLHKLMIGAMGTLGTITKINFRTFPAPLGARAFVAAFASAEKALDLRRRIAQSALRTLMVELLSPAAAEILSSARSDAGTESRQFPANAFRAGCWSLAVGFAGNDATLRRYERELQEAAAKAGAMGVMLLDPSEAAGGFSRHREWIPIVLESFPSAAILKMGVPPARMGNVLAASEMAAEEQGLRWAAIARGVGVIYLALAADAKSENEQKVARATRQIQEASIAAGGHATVPWRPAEWKAPVDVWGGEPAAAEQMRKLKGVFDPHGILSPGRFAAGV